MARQKEPSFFFLRATKEGGFINIFPPICLKQGIIMMKRRFVPLEKNSLMGQAGFTLMELMIAAMVLVIALTGIITAYVVSSNLNATSRNLTITMNWIQGEMERIRHLPFTQISTKDGSSFEIAGIADADSEGVIEVDNSNANLLVITMTVCWRQRGNRIIGEDLDLDGDLDAGEDANGNGRLDSPAQIVTLISRR